MVKIRLIPPHKQKVTAAVKTLHLKGYRYFSTSPEGLLHCKLCDLKLAYRDADTYKRHLCSQRHKNNVNFTKLK